jgi:hypothetical protein
MNTHLAALYAAVLLAALAACASPISVGADYDRQADFSAWKSWAFASPAQAAPDALVDRRIRAAVEKVLAERGYAQAPADAADFLVGHQTQVKQETSVISSGYDPYWGPRYSYRGSHWGHSSVDVYQYDVGTLWLDLLDRRGGFVAWRGRASATLDDSLEPQERDARVEEAVRKMLAQFPPTAQ